MSVSTPLLDTIEPDDSEDAKKAPPKPQSAKKPVVLTPGNRAPGSGTMATSESDAESGALPCISPHSGLMPSRHSWNIQTGILLFAKP
jgi:hypothetical protein